ncbi:uncharacterized protein [Bemisia tabaci]|uniref:uncharacterized protein n=1 Tax=Bemisia tabaci TaxID=7038 RepID=UPI003B282F00
MLWYLHQIPAVPLLPHGPSAQLLYFTNCNTRNVNIANQESITHIHNPHTHTLIKLAKSNTLAGDEAKRKRRKAATTTPDNSTTSSDQNRKKTLNKKMSTNSDTSSIVSHEEAPSNNRIPQVIRKSDKQPSHVKEIFRLEPEKGDRICELTCQRDALIKEITDIKNENSTLSNSNLKMRKEIEYLNKEIVKLKSDLRSKECVEELHCQRDALIKEITDIKKANNSLSNTNLILSNKSESLNENVVKLNKMLNDKSKEIESQLAEIKLSNIKIQKLIRDNKKLTDQLLSHENTDDILLSKTNTNIRPKNNPDSLSAEILREKLNHSFIPDALPNSTKRNLLLLSASHGRGLSFIFKDILGSNSNFNIISIFKPNAMIEHVIENLEDLTKNFTEEDIVVIIGGSNNFNSHSRWNVNRCYQKLNDIIERVKKPKIFIREVLPRYDLPPNMYNQFCQFGGALNNMFSRIASNTNNVQTLPNKVVNRVHFTNHGFHLNRWGKKLFVNAIMTSLIYYHDI